MLSKLITTLCLKLLKSAKITADDKARIINAFLSKIHTLPTRDVFSFDEMGGLKIRNKPLTVEQVLLLKDSAMTLRDSYARNLINEQMTYEAIKMGVYQGMNSDMILFSKAWLYTIEQENKLIAQITDQ